ncbi:transposase, partial [Ectopseudomonas mendocina]
MISVPEPLPDDPAALKQLLAEVLSSAQKLAKDKDGQIEHLREQNALLIQRLFGRKSEQTADPDSPQLEIFNEAESLTEAAPETTAEEIEEDVVAPVKRRGKRKPLPAELPRVEVIHELPEHELTCACGACKQVIGEETSEQLEIIPMQVRVIRHIRKTYACKACEAAPITADKPAQLIEKSLATPSVLAMLLTTKYADGIPLYRFEKVLHRHGIDILRQTLAR